MTLSHRLKLIVARFRWLSKKREDWQRFNKNKELFRDLLKQAVELELENNRLARIQPTANFEQNTPLARYHYTKGKLDKIKEILNVTV